MTAGRCEGGGGSGLGIRKPSEVVFFFMARRIFFITEGVLGWGWACPGRFFLPRVTTEIGFL